MPSRIPMVINNRNGASAVYPTRVFQNVSSFNMIRNGFNQPMVNRIANLKPGCSSCGK